MVSTDGEREERREEKRTGKNVICRVKNFTFRIAHDCQDWKVERCANIYLEMKVSFFLCFQEGVVSQNGVKL